MNKPPNLPTAHCRETKCKHTNATRTVCALLTLFASVSAHAFDPPVPAEQQGLPLNWERRLDSTNGGEQRGSPKCNSDRFTCVMALNNPTDYRAVRDNETGLVWIRIETNLNYDWHSARRHCVSKTIGGKWGWRLPNLHELQTLIEYQENADALQFPSDHPFTDVTARPHWSATTSASDPERAWAVSFRREWANDFPKETSFRVLCVRGPTSATIY